MPKYEEETVSLFHHWIPLSPGKFWASKGLTKDSRKAIPLTPDDRREIGILFLTKGPDAAIGYVKHIERTQERQRRKIITYGFFIEESARQFAYCPQLYFRADAPIGERLCMFKKIRDVLGENDGRVVTSAECELDGEYRPGPRPRKKPDPINTGARSRHGRQRRRWRRCPSKYGILTAKFHLLGASP